MWALEFGNGEVGREFESALFVVVGKCGNVSGALE
jgi:hypothetical protein